MNVTGTIKHIYDTKQVTEKYRTREFVVTIGEDIPYPQHCVFQCANKHCDLLDYYKPGEEVVVQFNVKGREWNGPQGIKYFNTLEAWRIEKYNRI
jgi:hypothetical protein